MRRLYALVFGVVLSLSAIAPAVAKDHPVGGLDMYSTTVDAATAGRLASAGYDIVDQQINADGKVRLSIVLSGPERAQLRREGVTTDLIRDAKGKTSRQRAAAQATAGFNVWRSWDETGGIRDELYDIAKKNPQLRQARGPRPHRSGPRDHRAQGHPGRQGPDGRNASGGAVHLDPARPGVDLGRGEPALAALVHRQLAGREPGDRRICSRRPSCGSSSSPTRTATSTRSTTSGCGARTCATTTATARSQPATASTPTATSPSTGTTTRRARPARSAATPIAARSAGPSPRRRRCRALLDRVQLQVPGQLPLVRPAGCCTREGWQTGTPTADDPIYYALSGQPTRTRRSRASIRASSPTCCTSPTARRPTTRTPSRHAGLDAGARGGLRRAAGSCSPTTRRWCRRSSRRPCRSHSTWPSRPPTPANPVSHLGITTKPFYLQSDDTDKGGCRWSTSRSTTSYGDPQEVRVLAKRSLGAVTLKYSINGGADTYACRRGVDWR